MLFAARAAPQLRINLSRELPKAAQQSAASLLAAKLPKKRHALVALLEFAVLAFKDEAVGARERIKKSRGSSLSPCHHHKRC